MMGGVRVLDRFWVVGTIQMRRRCDWLTGSVQTGWPMLLGGEWRDDRDGMTLCLG